MKDRSSWRSIYKLGAAAAIIAVVLFRRNLGTELVTFGGFGIFSVPETMPVSAEAWFALLQQDKFIGLALLNIFDVVNYVLVGLLFLAVYGALRETERAGGGLALAFALAGMTVNIATNQAFGMLNLSRQYAGAASDVQQQLYLAAGEALLAVDNPGLVFSGMGNAASLFLVLVAGLVLSIIMLRGEVFGRAAGIIGMIANGVGLLFFPALAFWPETVWLVAIPPSLSAPFRIIWYIITARKLIFLGKNS